MVTTNQKPMIGAQKIKRKESKHNTNNSYQTTKEQEKKGTEKNYIDKQKTINNFSNT